MRRLPVLTLVLASCAARADVRDAIERLDDDDIEVREQAQRELTAMGADAETALRETRPASPEQEARIEEILWTVEVRRGMRPEPVWLEFPRAVHLVLSVEHEWRIEGATDRYGRFVSWTYGCLMIDSLGEDTSIVPDPIDEAYVFPSDVRVVWGTVVVRIGDRPAVELPFQFVR